MKKERKGMSYYITDTLHTTIDTGESYITQIQRECFPGAAIKKVDPKIEEEVTKAYQQNKSKGQKY